MHCILCVIIYRGIDLTPFYGLDIESRLCDLWNYGCQVWHGSEIALLCGVPGQSTTRPVGMCMMHWCFANFETQAEICVRCYLEEKLITIVSAVLVARPSLLRDHLCPRQNLDYHHLVAHYR